MFRITQHKGFHLELPSGICVSVQFGAGNYGDHYHADFGFEQHERILASSQAEVMMWDTHSGQDGKRGREVTQEWRPDAHGQVLGWASPADVADAIAWAAAYTRNADSGLAPALSPN